MSPADSSVSIEPCTVLDVWIYGRVCEGGCCRPIMQKLHGRVYETGDSYLAWHLPSDPLRGGYRAEPLPSAGVRSRSLWTQWAESSE